MCPGQLRSASLCPFSNWPKVRLKIRNFFPPPLPTLSILQTIFSISGDYIQIRRGYKWTDPLIARFNASAASNQTLSTIPTVRNITVLSSSILVEFIATTKSPRRGFSAAYTSEAAFRCSGLKNFSGPAGEISDGSGYQPYLPGLDCSWGISVMGARYFLFSQWEIDLAPGDLVTISRGNIDAPIITLMENGTLFNGSFVPATQFQDPIGIESSAVFVNFKSVSGGMQGFKFRYHASNVADTMCKQSQVETNITGTIWTGPFNGNYSNAASCTWLIIPPFSIRVWVRFRQFQLEDGIIWLFFFKKKEGITDI